VVRTSLSIFRVKAGSLLQLLKSSTVDFLLNSTEISAKFVHFVIVIFLEDTSLYFGERPLTEEEAAKNRASWDGGIKQVRNATRETEKFLKGLSQQPRYFELFWPGKKLSTNGREPKNNSSIT